MVAARIVAVLMLFTTGTTLAQGLLAPRGKAPELLPVDEAFRFEGLSGKGGARALQWVIAPGYYLYGHQFKVSVDAPAGLAAPALRLPAGEAKHDAEFGDVTVHRGVLTVPLAPGGARTLRVRYQGCADAGVCYPPQTRIVAVKAP